MNTNLFPAILLAGPPHCGKSVLAFLLTYHLRALGIAHYLLRAVPDGEGDWFLTGQPEVVQTLRAIHKVGFSSQFVRHMHTAIESRPLPLLVDIGGRPQGEQFGLIQACTHFILLYRTEEERRTWREWLNDSKLLPIAELRSITSEDATMSAREPFLRGQINGLERDPVKRKAGMVFGMLLEHVAGICSYDAISLEQTHLKHAPLPVINERELARQLSVPVDGESTVWSSFHLARIPEFVPLSQPLAIYGRGPIWLAAALAIRTLPESFSIFDARYGWLFPPPLHFSEHATNLKVNVVSFQAQDTWIEIELPGGTLEPDEINLKPIHFDTLDRAVSAVQTQGGLVLSGKIPRWLCATLVHTLALNHAWVAVDDPRLSQAIVVHSNSDSHRPGDSLPRLVK